MLLLIPNYFQLNIYKQSAIVLLKSHPINTVENSSSVFKLLKANWTSIHLKSDVQCTSYIKPKTKIKCIYWIAFHHQFGWNEKLFTLMLIEISVSVTHHTEALTVHYYFEGKEKSGKILKIWVCEWNFTLLWICMWVLYTFIRKLLPRKSNKMSCGVVWIESYGLFIVVLWKGYRLCWFW